ncbi:MAG: hypothetical protein IT428_32270 [Planctomycetaceae bacterium]|nr:hypothetical protein [Planctomycetaceae bacterium]
MIANKGKSKILLRVRDYLDGVFPHETLLNPVQGSIRAIRGQFFLPSQRLSPW